MSKKNKASAKNKELPLTEEKPGKKNISSHTAGINSMTNRLIALVAVLPVLYSAKLIEPVISIRYTFLGVFILLFLLVFFSRSKKIIPAAIPLPIVIVFALAVMYVIWSLASLTNAINPREGIYI